MTRSLGTAASGGDCGVSEQSKCQPSRRDSIMTIMSCCRSSSSFNNSIWLESCYEGEEKAEEKTLWPTVHSITQTTDGQPSCLISGYHQGWLELWGPTTSLPGPQRASEVTCINQQQGLMLFCCLKSIWLGPTDAFTVSQESAVSAP